MRYPIILFVTCLMAITTMLSAINIGQGSFSMQIDASIRASKHDKSLDVLEELVCQAIKNRSVLELIVEISNSGKYRQFVIEPYVLGYTRSGEMMIQGYKVDQVTLTGNINATEFYLNRGGTIFQKEERTGDSRTTRLSRVVRIEVLKNIQFNIREVDFDEGIDETLKVICSVY